MIGETLWVRLPLDRVTISMSSCFQFAAMLCLGRSEAMLVAAASGLVSELAFVRKPLVRATYNAAQTALAIGAAGWVFHLLAGSAGAAELLVRFHLLPFAGAAATYYLVNRAAVTIAVALSRDLRFDVAWRENFGNRLEWIGCGAVLSMGALLGAGYERLGVGAAALVILPLLFVRQGYRRSFEAKRVHARAAGRLAA